MDFDPNAVGVYNLGVYVYSLEGALLASSEISVETVDSCNDPLASNYNMGDGACTYCESTNNWTVLPEEEFTIGSGLSNDHMNVGVDACNGITASLGVLERYADNVEPEAGNLTNYQVNNGFADVPEGCGAWCPLELPVECEFGRVRFRGRGCGVWFGLRPGRRLRRR